MSIQIKWKKLLQLCSSILIKNGLSEADAFTVAESLVFANLRGIDSHGVVRLPAYVRRLENGGVKARPKIKILQSKAASAVLDGDQGMGQVIGRRATELAVQKAKTAGVAFVVARGSAHYGAASYYSALIARENMIGFTTTGTTPSVAAWGGAGKVIGNDPLSIVVPFKRGNPITLDISMSKVAGGKLKLAARNKEKIPIGWGIDKHGRHTDNPNGILDGGAHLPFGEHKGYGLAVMMEILNGVLSGASVLGQIQSWTKYPENPSNIGQCFAAVDIGSFIELKLFRARLRRFVGEIKASPPMSGIKEILMPGEIEAANEAARRKDGIPISPKVWGELESLALEYGENPEKALK